MPKNDVNNFTNAKEPPSQLNPPLSAQSAGATPVYVSRGALFNSTTGGTVLAPSGLATDQIELMVVESQAGTHSLTTANGFVSAASQVDVPNATATIATHGSLWWRRYAGQADPVVASATNHVIAQRYSFSGCATTGDPWDFIEVSSEATEDTSGSATGNTTLDANRLIAVIVGSAKPDSNSTAEVSAFTNAALTSLTERADNAGNSGNGGHLGMACGEKAVAGAVGATTYTKATTAYKWHYVVALKPPDEGGATAISRSDSVTVTESKSLDVGVTVSKSESVTISEAVARLITSPVAVSESVSVSESVPVQLPDALLVGKSEAITVTESAIVSIQGGTDLLVTVNDAVLVTESVGVLISTAVVNKSESIALSEAVSIDLTRLIAVSDTITVSESVALIDGVTISKSESITVTESRTVTATRLISVTDNITVTESKALDIGLEITKSESITLSEIVSVTVSAPQIGCSESVTLTDTPQVSLGTLMIIVFSNITVTETFNVAFPSAAGFIHATIAKPYIIYAEVIPVEIYTDEVEMYKMYAEE